MEWANAYFIMFKTASSFRNNNEGPQEGTGMKWWQLYAFFYECISLCIANVTVNILYRWNAWLLSHLMEALLNNEVMEPYKEWMLFQRCQCFKNLHGWKNTWQSKMCVCEWVCVARRAFPSTSACSYKSLLLVSSLPSQMLKYTQSYVF